MVCQKVNDKTGENNWPKRDDRMVSRVSAKGIKMKGRNKNDF